MWLTSPISRTSSSMREIFSLHSSNVFYQSTVGNFKTIIKARSYLSLFDGIVKLWEAGTGFFEV